MRFMRRRDFRFLACPWAWLPSILAMLWLSRDDSIGGSAKRAPGLPAVSLTRILGANTPAVSLFQLAYPTRHSHSTTCAITSPNSNSAADQTSAETKLAIWNGQ